MRITQILLVIALFVSCSFAQSSEFVKDMEIALTIEDTASSYSSVVKAAKNIEKLTQKYPNQWLALYWTAHVYSQCAVFSVSSPEKAKYAEYIDIAQSFYDRAWSANKNMDKIDKSDFYALQSNIYGLRISQYQRLRDWENVGKYAQLKVDFLEKAEVTNLENPMVWTLKGVGLLRDEKTREKGKNILMQAIEKYENIPTKSSIHPRWGRQWIDFWLQRYGLSSNN